MRPSIIGSLAAAGVLASCGVLAAQDYPTRPIRTITTTSAGGLSDIFARAIGEELLGLLQKMIKQRQESVELYDKGGRPELATKERDEIAIIASFLPKQMSDDEVKSAIAAIVKETGAASMKDMGRVMAALKERYSGKMDFAKAGGLVKAQLGS